MNQSELKIVWDRATGNLQVFPKNMTETEVIPLLLNTMTSLSNSTLERAKGIQLASAMPPVIPGN